MRRHLTTSAILGGFLLLALGLSAVALRGGPGREGTSTSTSATSTTSTVEAPTTTTAPPATPAPTTRRAAAPTAAPTTAEPAPATAPPPTTAAGEPCAQALIGVRAVGLPAGWAFYCSAEKAQSHAGIAYWNSAGGSYIAVSPGKGDHPGVGAHEACHAQDFAARGTTSEDGADACAAAHGYPNPYAADEDFVTESPAERATHWLVLAVLVAGLVLIVALLTLLPIARRRLRQTKERV